MARGVLTPIQITRDGVAITAGTTGDASNGHTTANDGAVWIYATNTNGSATARIITVLTPGQVDGLAIADKAVSIAAGASRGFGPYPTSQYGTTLNIDVAHADIHFSVYHL